MKDGLYQPCRNVSPSPEDSFIISSEETRLLLDDAVAYVHSECYTDDDINRGDGVESGGLSKSDMEHQWAMGIPLGVLKVLDGVTSGPYWYGDSLPVADLLGRPFVNGIWDCYASIRDVFRCDGFGIISEVYHTKSIILPDYPRNYEWWGSQDANGKALPATENLYMDNFEAAGFRSIDISELRKGDVFLAQIGSDVTNHGGIYCGDGEIYHHLRRRLSRREPAPQWIKFVTEFLRYEP